MLIDYHIHSTFSNDSVAKLDDICQTAIERGISKIAITDHVDYKYPIQPPDYALEDFEGYFGTIAQYQRQYQGKLDIAIGIEIGLEEHHLETYDKLLKQYPFDFVIASLHMIDTMEPHLGVYYEGKTKEEAFRIYYDKITSFVESYDNFDVIGHLDYVKRYMPYPSEEGDHLLALDAVDRLLKAIIAKRKGIEINTSGFKHISNASMPHFDIVKRYHALGGRRLTIGTDSHDARFVGYKVKETADFLRSIGIKEVMTFHNRQEITVAL